MSDRITNDGRDGVVDRICQHLASSPDATPGEARTRAVASARTMLPLATADEIAGIVALAVARVHGLGPLQPLLADPSINEVMVNAGGDVWVERAGTTIRAGRLDTDVTSRLIERILAPTGRRIDRLSPVVDARLPDGSRVCAVVEPIAIDGPCFSIRRFAIHRRRIDEFASPAVCELLRSAVERRCNIVISGSTSSGKTSALNALAAFVAPGERIITLEDTAELRLDAPHVLRLETRPASVDGIAAVTMTDLVRTSLRLRPDRLVLGEIRGGEVVDLLQALNTGHRGSLATVHANSAADALRRIETLVVQHAPSWPLPAVREHVRSSLDLVVHVDRHADGGRQVSHVLELAGADAPEMTHRLVVADGRVVQSLSRGRT